MSLFGEYGASKIGRTIVLQVPVTTWTEVVIGTVVSGNVPCATSWVVKSAGTVYIAQANHSLKIASAVQTLPANPSTATSGNGPGLFELGANLPWRVDVENSSESSLWFWATALTIVRLTELTRTQFDLA